MQKFKIQFHWEETIEAIDEEDAEFKYLQKIENDGETLGSIAEKSIKIIKI